MSLLASILVSYLVLPVAAFGANPIGDLVLGDGHVLSGTIECGNLYIAAGAVVAVDGNVSISASGNITILGTVLIDQCH
jgi:hypothetical protein